MDARGEGDGAMAALGELCRIYWFPIYGFARGLGLAPEDAEDATQELFRRVVDRQIMSRVEPGVGRLRSYLIASLKNGVSQQRRREARIKRGGGVDLVSIDAEEAEGRYLSDQVNGEDPEKAFERRWVAALLETAIAHLRAEYVERGQQAGFEELLPLLIDCERGVSFREVAHKLGKSEGAIRLAVFRLRKRFRALVRAEIIETVADSSQIDGEIEELFAAVAK